jgi:hypothetical protein
VRASLRELDAMQGPADPRRQHVGLPVDQLRRIDDTFAVASARLQQDSLA